VENKKLRTEVSKDQEEGTTETEQLREEISEFRQSLHETQEREVSSNDLLDKSRVDYDELKSVYDGVVVENERLTSEFTEYQARYNQTCAELKRVRDAAEVELHHALTEECVKWERREATSYLQLKGAHTSAISGTSVGTLGTGTWTVSVSDSVLSPMVVHSPPIAISRTLEIGGAVVSSGLRATASAFAPIASVSVTHLSGGATSLSMSAPLRMSTEALLSDDRITGSPLAPVFPSLISSTSIAPPVSDVTVLPPPLTAYTRCPLGGVSVTPAIPAISQLSPINKFKGEDPDQEGGNFEEWIEQFELIAEAYGWDSRTQLVNLTVRLQGQAYSFYRTCSPEQRSDYTSLKSQLMTRFTPVQLQAVHSNLFHQRRQEETETVDHYAQELKKLFYRAYPRASQATEQAEGFGRSVLAYQFVAGLKRNLQSKVAGIEGDFEQLLVRARFEEAKIRDLSSQNDRHFNGGNNSNSGSKRSISSGQQGKPTSGGRSNSREVDHCFTCHGTGHYARNCPYKGRSVPAEAQGRSSNQGKSHNSKSVTPTTANLREENVLDSARQAKAKVAKLREELRAAELEGSLAKDMVTTNVLHGSQDTPDPTPKEKDQERPLQGPVMEVEIHLEG